MKPVLVEDYNNPIYRALTRSVLTNFLLENKKLPFPVAFDSTLIHYKPWSQIVFNPRAKSAWKTILEKYYESDAYKVLNNAVAGDPLLSKYATIHFLNTLSKKTKRIMRKLNPDNTYTDNKEKSEEGTINSLLENIDKLVSQKQYSQASGIINELAAALEDEAKEVLKDIETIESFTHIGIPIANMLEKPDEFREKARNKIIAHLVRFLQKLRREAPSLKQTKAPTLVGGRPLGVKRLQRPHELVSILPSEFLDDDLLSYRIASRSVLVRERYGNIQNYIVYLDKSGSMADNIIYYTSPTQYEYVPKISFAAASALALASALRRLGAKMTLKLFDVEVHDPITDYAKLLDVLMRIEADSGTNITNVLEDALKHRDEKIIIVTDGIDEVSEEAARRARSSNLDITFIFIKTDNKLLRKYFPCVYVDKARPSILLEV